MAYVEGQGFLHLGLLAGFNWWKNLSMASAVVLYKHVVFKDKPSTARLQNNHCESLAQDPRSQLLHLLPPLF
jgi:hypothetical protein